MISEEEQANLDMLFKKLKRNDPDEMDVFWSWISCRSLKEVRGEEA